MPIKALAIDLDGTLYSEDKIYLVDEQCAVRAQEYLQKKGLLEKVPKKRMMQIGKQMESGNVSSNIRRLSKRFNLNYEEFNRYVNDLRPKEFGITKDAKLVRLLTKASKRYKLFVFTNAPEIWVRRAISDIGLGRLLPFKKVVCLECMGNYLKPDRESYRAMLRITGMRRQDILFLDDKQANVSAGRRFGIKSMRVSNTHTNKRNSIYSILERICSSPK
jgi:HAD superfamily hydrolase (TIGR01509 family)